jgi:cytoskeleton protein RodZ
LLQDRKSRLMQARPMMSARDGGGLATRVGGDIKAARERLGWELPAVAAYLRIRLPYLEAIEDGRIADLPGNAYAVGFLRTYAQALGLDPAETARRFREEASQVNQKVPLDFPAPVPERGVPAGAVVLLGVVLAIGAYAGWYKMSGSDRPESQPVQPVPPRLMPLAEAPAPLLPPTPAPAPAPDVAASEALPALPSISPSSAAAAIPMQPLVPAPMPAALPAAVPPGPDGSRITLRAKTDAWMQVRDAKGTVLLNRVLRGGETWPVPGKSQGTLLLTTGNAGGTEILVDGLVTASLGGDGAVRRDLPLDADPIRDGKLAAAAAPAAPAAGRTPPKPQ